MKFGSILICSLLSCQSGFAANTTSDILRSKIATVCEILNYRPWVDIKIKGLYDKFPTPNRLEVNLDNNMTLHIYSENDGQTVIAELISADGKAKGEVIRSIFDSKSVVFDGALLPPEIPPWVKIPGVPDLVEGKGIPTHLAMTLYSFKLQRVAEGALTKAESIIKNEVTMFELSLLPEVQNAIQSGDMQTLTSKIQEAYMRSQSGKIMETVLIQTGHRVKNVKISNVETGTMLKAASLKTPLEIARNRGTMYYKSFYFKTKYYMNTRYVSAWIKPIRRETSEISEFLKQNNISRHAKELSDFILKPTSVSLETSDLKNLYTLLDAVSREQIARSNKEFKNKIAALQKQIEKEIKAGTTIQTETIRAPTSFHVDLELEPL